MLNTFNVRGYIFKMHLTPQSLNTVLRLNRKQMLRLGAHSCRASPTLGGGVHKLAFQPLVLSLLRPLGKCGRNCDPKRQWETSTECPGVHSPNCKPERKEHVDIFLIVGESGEKISFDNRICLENKIIP